ncbi:MAG: hypothetical protein J6Y87_06410 [Muribaculaceae bacterium]|nr:hypothetical protein [Muribaculaceae bacterium]
MKNKLINEIENAVGKKLTIPSDFDYLSDCVLKRNRAYVSRTTLMRLWGYISENVRPSRTTLDILSRFVGYSGWEEFVAKHDGSPANCEPPSIPVFGRRLSVGDDLLVGDIVRLLWQPERVCDVVYLGDLKFRVVASVNTRLREGDTFQMSVIVEGEPLYLDNLRQADRPPIAYVCGKISGVMFERV